MKVMALDFGSARTGVAVSDPTGTIARPLGVVEQALSKVGLTGLCRLVSSEGVDKIVVGPSDLELHPVLPAAQPGSQRSNHA